MSEYVYSSTKQKRYVLRVCFSSNLHDAKLNALLQTQMLYSPLESYSNIFGALEENTQTPFLAHWIIDYGFPNSHLDILVVK
ncbi:hypothetical protein ACTXT7_008454 [Hymenolepis weldensis]